MRPTHAEVMGSNLFVTGAITLAIGLLLVPIVADFTAQAATNPNITGATSTMLDLVPFLYVVAVVGAAIAQFKQASKGSGA